MGESRVFKCNVGKTAYFYGLILFYINIQKEWGLISLNPKWQMQ